MRNCFHLMRQQVLAQDLLVYLIALTAINAINSLMISLSLSLNIFSNYKKIVLIYSNFSFVQYLLNKNMVLAIRLVYSIGRAKIHIEKTSYL